MAEHAWCSDPARDEDVRAAEDGRQGPLPTLEECISRAGQFAPSEPPQERKCTERESGMRTERVVPPAPVSRPAETRLSQQAKAQKISGWWWFPASDKPAPPPPPAPPRVHRGSGVFDTNGDEVPWEGVVAALKDERDSAIRERDEAKARVDYLERDRKVWALQSGSFEKEANALKARVAELESELESVACRAATAETALESAPAASGAANSPEETKSWEPVAWGQHPASGWLAQDEIAVCVGLRDFCRGTWETWGRKDTLWLNRATTLDALLARSSPPEVER